MNLIALCLAGYMLGSLPFAVIVSRAFGLADPRSYGSRNPGATNVLRSGNKLAAALTLLGDAAKGWLAVWLALLATADAAAAAIAGLAAFIGHVFPVFLGFKGGKGVATALGILLGLSPTLAAGAALCWLAVAALTRYSSLAAIVTALAVAVASWPWLGEPRIAACISMLCTILVWRHEANIRKLIAGTEGKIGS